MRSAANSEDAETALCLIFSARPQSAGFFAVMHHPYLDVVRKARLDESGCHGQFRVSDRLLPAHSVLQSCQQGGDSPDFSIVQ